MKKISSERMIMTSMMIPPSELKVVAKVSANLGISQAEFFRRAVRKAIYELAKTKAGKNG